MKTVHINASTEYDVLIGGGLLSQTGEKCRALFGKCEALTVTDANVEKLYLEKVKNSLEKCGIKVFSFVFEAGESSKNKETLFDILEFAAENGIDRNGIFISLGGGVAGDITGLAASLYLRGIPFVQLPTTLLAAVDSSVGGKTAVDLAHGKNLAGAFYQPSLVICDTDTFKTLDKRTFACGTAEVIKYGILFDEELFEAPENDIETTVHKCIELKKKCVEADEFDRGERRLLNLGHTFAHAVEKLSGFAIPHGEAVAIGTVKAAELSLKMNICSAETVERIKKAFELRGLPVSCDFSRDDTVREMMSDKKRSGGEIAFILPEKIGHCIIKSIKYTEI